MEEVFKKFYITNYNLLTRVKVLLTDGAYSTVYATEDSCGNCNVEFINTLNAKLGINRKLWTNRRCVRYLLDLADKLVEEPKLTVIGWYSPNTPDTCEYEVLDGYNFMYAILMYYSGKLSLSESDYTKISKALMTTDFYLKARMSDNFDEPTHDELVVLYNYYVGNKE